MKMQLSRDHVHVSMSGLSIEFKKDVPTHVPKRLVAEIIGIGGTAAHEDKAAEAVARAELEALRAENEGRGPKILEAVHKMVTRNQRGDYTAQGRPNLKILSGLVGFDVTPEELSPIWEKVKAGL